MTETRDERTRRSYAEAERSLDVVNARRVRRGPEVAIAVLVVLSLAFGVVAAVDLRRLMTPRGAALAWAGAAVFGDCTAYERLSVAAPGVSGDPGSKDARCAGLVRRTADARAQSSAYGIELLSVVPDGRRAQARLRLTAPGRREDVQLELVRVADGWAVVRSAQTCRVVGCG